MLDFVPCLLWPLTERHLGISPAAQGTGSIPFVDLFGNISWCRRKTEDTRGRLAPVNVVSSLIMVVTQLNQEFCFQGKKL